jgi:phosphoglycolate phosphatase
MTAVRQFMHMKYRLAIFDFDGTLADSFPFFIREFNQLAEQHGFKRIDPDLAPAYRHYNARQMPDAIVETIGNFT